MSSVLSNTQKAELHKSILAYLKKQGFEETFQSFQKATGFKLEAKYDSKLENKWKSILNLQKKISELEAKIKQIMEDIPGPKPRRLDASLALPREPPKFTLVGHRSPVTSVVFHPSFNLVVSASEDSTIKIWNADEGKIERTLAGHQDAVQDVAFNTTGTILASCSADLSIKIWNFETYDCVKTLNGHDHNVSAVTFVPSDTLNYLVSASRDKKIKLWDLNSGFCMRTFSGHEAWVRKVAVSPDGASIGSASADQTIRIWNLKTGDSKTGRDHDHVVEAIAFSNAKADQFILTMLAEEPKTDEIVPIADSNEEKNQDKKKDKKDGEGVGGMFMVSGSRDRTIKIWKVATGVCVKTLTGHDNWVRQVLFHPSGRFLLSCSDDKSIRVWDLTKGGRNTTKIEQAHRSFVSSIDWNRPSPLLASGSMDNTVNIWDCR